MPAAKWSIDKPASRRAQPAVAGRGLSEGLGPTRSPVLSALATRDEEHAAWCEDLGCVPDTARYKLRAATGDSFDLQTVRKFEVKLDISAE